MSTNKALKKVSRTARITLIAFLVSQLPINPSFAAELILDSTTGMPAATVDATTEPSTNTSATQTQTQTSTQFLANGGTLSSATTTAVVSGAYGNASAEDLPGDDYMINGSLTPANEVSGVQVPLTYNYTQQVVITDKIDITPLYDIFNYETKQSDRHFVTLQSGQTAVLSDSTTYSSSLSRNEEPMETIPNFVMINGTFTQVTLTPKYNGFGGKTFEVSFTVPQLKGDGTDKIKFLSPYNHSTNSLLALQYAVSANASLWARFGNVYGTTSSSDSVTFISSAGTQAFSTGLAANDKIVDFYFSQDGTKFTLKTANQTIVMDVQTSTTTIKAPSNSNFDFNIINSTDKIEVVLVNKITQTQTSIATTTPDRTLGAMDVDPQGRYAFVNLQYNLDGRPTGDIIVFDIQNKTRVTVDNVNSSNTGAQPVGRVSSYRFLDNGTQQFVLFNSTRQIYIQNLGYTTTVEQGNVLNLSTHLIQYTATDSIQVQDPILFTPGNDKMVFVKALANNYTSNYSLAVYDIATGLIKDNALYNSLQYGYAGIKAMRPDGEFVIVASPTNAIYVVGVRSGVKTSVVFPVSLGESAASYTFQSVKFLGPPGYRTALFTLANGKLFSFDFNQLRLRAVVPARSNPNFLIFERVESSISAYQVTYQEFYDIRTFEGNLVTTIIKDQSFKYSSGLETIQSLDKPDVSANGAYLIHGFISSCTITSSSCTPKQKLEVRDLQSGQLLNTFLLRDPLKDRARSLRFSEGTQKTIAVAYQSGIVEYYEADNPNQITIQTPTPSNPNYSFAVMSVNNVPKEIRLVNNQTMESTLLATLKSGESVGPMDVDPAGKYALLNIQRRQTLSNGYVDTGDFLLFNIADKTFVQPERIQVDPLTFEAKNIGTGPVETRIFGVYRFIEGLVLFNSQITTSATATTHHPEAFVLNLNTPTPRITDTPLTGILTNYEPVFTPQKDKLLFGGSEGGNHVIGIYDTSTGAAVYQRLQNYGFDGIKAVTADGEKAIVATQVNTVYVVSVRNLAQATQAVFIPVPSGQSATSYSLVQVKLPGPYLAELYTKNGKRYFLDIRTAILIPPSVISKAFSFYGGALPSGAVITDVRVFKNSAGQTVYDVTVRLNQKTAAGAIQNQVLMLRPISGIWVVKEVRDRDASNALVMRSVFTYSSTAQLQKIDRYNAAGTLRSTIVYTLVLIWGLGSPTFRFLTSSGVEFRTAMSATTPLYQLLLAAAAAGR